MYIQYSIQLVRFWTVFSIAPHSAAFQYLSFWVSGGRGGLSNTKRKTWLVHLLYFDLVWYIWCRWLSEYTSSNIGLCRSQCLSLDLNALKLHLFWKPWAGHCRSFWVKGSVHPKFTFFWTIVLSSRMAVWFWVLSELKFQLFYSPYVCTQNWISKKHLNTDFCRETTYKNIW